MGSIAFGLAVALASARVVWGLRQRRSAEVVVSAISLVTYVFFLYVPGVLQVTGAIESKLVRVSLLGPPDWEELSTLALRWSVELVLFVVGEIVAFRLRPTRDPDVSEMLQPDRRLLVVLLLAVGFLAFVVFPPPGLEERASGGQGLGTVLRGSVTSGLALLIYYRFFGRRFYGVVFAAGVAALVLTNIRSPVVVVFFGLVAYAINAEWFSSLRRVLAVIGVVLVISLVGATMSNLRANSVRNYGYTPTEVVEQTLSSPWIAPYEAGIDTLDGYRLSQYVSPREGARPDSLLTVVTTFVPRALWPDKPEELSVEISRKYLGYTASGQFLSTPGYFMLAFGSYPAALVAILGFSLLASLLVSSAYGTFWLIFVLVGFFRSQLGGGPFDVYYALVLALPVAVAMGALHLMRGTARGRAPRRRNAVAERSSEL